jgi:hypothetical protein
MPKTRPAGIRRISSYRKIENDTTLTLGKDFKNDLDLDPRRSLLSGKSGSFSRDRSLVIDMNTQLKESYGIYSDAVLVFSSPYDSNNVKYKFNK